MSCQASTTAALRLDLQSQIFQSSTTVYCILYNFQRVICPKEYRRVVKEISDTLSHAIEMVQVVFNNDQMSFGSRLHVCIS